MVDRWYVFIDMSSVSKSKHYSSYYQDAGGFNNVECLSFRTIPYFPGISVFTVWYSWPQKLIRLMVYPLLRVSYAYSEEVFWWSIEFSCPDSPVKTQSLFLKENHKGDKSSYCPNSENIFCSGIGTVSHKFRYTPSYTGTPGRFMWAMRSWHIYGLLHAVHVVLQWKHQV